MNPARADGMPVGHQVALKFIDRATLVGRQFEMLAREVRAMQLVTHPSVLQLIEVQEEALYPRIKGKGV